MELIIILSKKELLNKEMDLVGTKWGQLIILGTILYTDNLGTSFRTSWGPQGERKKLSSYITLFEI